MSVRRLKCAVELVRADDIRVSLRSYPPGYDQPKHAHPVTHLTLVLGGSIQETVGSRCERAGPLSVVLKPAGVGHADSIGPWGADTFQVWVPERVTQGALDFKIRSLRWRWLHGGSVARQMLLLLRDLRGRRYPHTGRCQQHENLQKEVFSILAQVGREEQVSLDQKAAPEWLLEVKESIDARALHGLRVPRLAAEARVHPIYLARLFRRYFGCSVCGYIKQARFRATATLIQRSGTALTEIAFRAGFSDQAHMCREFKTGTGLTPRVFRELTGAQ